MQTHARMHTHCRKVRALYWTYTWPSSQTLLCSVLGQCYYQTLLCFCDVFFSVPWPNFPSETLKQAVVLSIIKTVGESGYFGPEFGPLSMLNYLKEKFTSYIVLCILSNMAPSSYFGHFKSSKCEALARGQRSHMGARKKENVLRYLSEGSPSFF